MATILLSAAGAAAGSAIGGSVMGLSTAVIGRAVGATIGRAIDQKLLGAGSQTVETGKVDRFRLVGASEGAAIPRVWGRMRVAGSVIWATQFKETITERTEGGSGGKGLGGGSRPETTIREHKYSVSLAIALCEGRIGRVARVWADGIEIAPDDFMMRVYPGTADQQPDPRISAVQGAGRTPAYRGTAYVVIEDLPLGRFGNRVPQMTFEVLRPEFGANPLAPVEAVRAVALIPGTGEYALSTERQSVPMAPGQVRIANVGSPREKPDFLAAFEDLRAELPNVRSVSLVVSWFGSDLRCGSCAVRPLVETRTGGSNEMSWTVAGRTRTSAGLVPYDGEGRPVYGATPADGSVIQAIQAIRGSGVEVMFYPFLLMEPGPGNPLPNPWTGGVGQPAYPWRGRITTSRAPGIAGSPDGTASAQAEVSAFFGGARASDFHLDGGEVRYTGPSDEGYARFILHYAWLCRAAGGVDAFCIGSEMRGLTEVRGAGGSYPAVEKLRWLLGEVRQVLGPGCKLSYAADWSEYSGHRPGNGEVRFHLDPLWAEPDCDFIGIDNYLPLSDWRSDEGHLDEIASASPHDLGYLRSGVAGGEWFDWYYASAADSGAQRRTPITDGDHDEPWVWRVKDLRSWWENAHHERSGGVRSPVPTAWVPRSKPIRFTEYGCGAVNLGPNQPNLFVDPKSSESALPRGSDGRRDEYAQMQYIRAVTSFWSDPANNPTSAIYGAPMIDMGRAHLWAWDSRPWPAFPGRADLWSDGPNYALGHWLNGRTAGRSLASIIAELCAEVGVECEAGDVHGYVRGYTIADVGSVRSALQPLLLAHGVDAVERAGRLRFVQRGLHVDTEVDPAHVAVGEVEGDIEVVRAPEAELPERLRVTYVEGEGSYEARVADVRLPGRAEDSASDLELDLALTGAEARGLAERALAETRAARDVLRLALPPSRSDVEAGDVVTLNGGADRWRVDRVEEAVSRTVTATRVDPAAYRAPSAVESLPAIPATVPAAPATAVFLDLPLMSGSELPAAPHIAFAAQPWPGSITLMRSADPETLGTGRAFLRPSLIGVTETELSRAAPGIWDYGPALQIHSARGGLQSRDPAAVLGGANAMAIGAVTGPFEVFQFVEAAAVGAGRWKISGRLRGQAGTDAVMPDVWPAGSTVVLLDGSPEQIDLPPELLGRPMHYRYGPSDRPPSDEVYRTEERSFLGEALRPLAPVHLRTWRDGGDDLLVGWTRRTRIDGDAWREEVPLAETAERYRVRVVRAGDLLRVEDVSVPLWTYRAEDRIADGSGTRVEVSQVSETFGPGHWAGVDL